jgi:hypothetical protein
MSPVKSERRFYDFTCLTCNKGFRFYPTPGQLRALEGGAQVKTICGCGKKYYYSDGGLKKLLKFEESMAALEGKQI